MDCLQVQRFPGRCTHLQSLRTEGNAKRQPQKKAGPSSQGNLLLGRCHLHIRGSAQNRRRDSTCGLDALLQNNIKDGFVVESCRGKLFCARSKPVMSAAAVPSNRDAFPEDADVLQDATREAPGALGWVRRKWEENRAEYHRLRKILKDLGLAGFLSYGLFNTTYYLVSFLFVWFFVAPSSSGLGVSAAAQRFLKIFAMVWAGSQVTKLLRAGGALLLAPLVDRGLNWFTAKGRFRSKLQAFWAIVGFCIVLALVVFVVIVSLWA